MIRQILFPIFETMKQTISLRVKKIIRETPGTISLLLEDVDKKAVPYQAGQFLTLLLRVHGHAVRRSYSLSSVPGIDPDMKITIRRVANGEVSRYLIDHIKEGDVLESLPPSGRFVLEASHTARDIFLVAGGSGIAPLLGLLKKALRDEPQSFVTLLYASHDEASTIYFSELQQWQDQYPERLRIHYFFSTPADKERYPPRRLQNTLFEQIVSNGLHFAPGDACFFLCGPAALMRMAELTLLFMGFASSQIRRENFVSPVLTAPPAHHAGAHATPSKAKIHYAGKIYEISIPAGENILQAALEQGIRLPYSCRGGLCSTCAARCRKGKVRMLVNEVLTERDIAEGWVLTCVGIPETGELEIDFDPS